MFNDTNLPDTVVLGIGELLKESLHVDVIKANAAKYKRGDSYGHDFG